MQNERKLNHYYNVGGFNATKRIGYIMSLIKKCNPITLEEWKVWYFEHVRSEEYLKDLAKEMYYFIPPQEGISYKECLDYIYDVMFRRTFEGYNKENQALQLLRKQISPDIKKAPKDWDTNYFIDFYFIAGNSRLIGIQLKPDTFFRGKYYDKVDIEGKIQKFCDDFQAFAYILQYSPSSKNSIVFSNPKTLLKIQALA